MAEEAFSYVPAPTRWAVDAGYGLRLWEADDPGSAEQREYENQAHSGAIFGGDISVYPVSWKGVGLGVVYNQFLRTITSAKLGFTEEIGERSDVYRIHYGAPTLFLRRDFGKFSMMGEVGAGFFYYYNRHQESDFPGVLEGGTAGVHAALSADYRFFSFLGIGMTARLLHGNVEKILYNGLPPEVTNLHPVSMTRVDLSGGLRFYP